MNALIHQTASELLHKPFEMVNAEELQQLCSKYPFFTPTKILLIAKLQENNKVFPSLIQHQIIPSSCNLLWINYLLNHSSPIIPSSQITHSDIAIDNAIKMEELSSGKSENENQEVSNTPAIEATENTEANKVSTEDVLVNITETEKTDPIITTNNVVTEAEIESIFLEVCASKASINNEVNEKKEASTHNFNVPIDNMGIAEQQLLSHIETEANNTNLPDPTLDEEKDKVEVIDPNKLFEFIAAQWSSFKEPIEAKEELIYEPPHLHTIDYFGSLGITADLTREPQDKLSKQLLKFTDWLKIIKNQHNTDSTVIPTTELDSIIPGIAQTSNETREIITETMAEVLVKQGKIDKAVQVYIKLSFLDPDKSAYFAKKIEQLKEM
jgi:hypothetical protein